MNAIQLEFNIADESEADAKIKFLQMQIDKMNESMDKVRRKLFAQMGEIQKLCHSLKQENQELKLALLNKNSEQEVWEYGQGEHLFLLKKNIS
jgi:hypothetical protein